MTSNEQALVALMENCGYSPGLVETAFGIARQSAAAVTELLLYIDDEHPTEQELIAYLAEMCE